MRAIFLPLARLQRDLDQAGSRQRDARRRASSTRRRRAVAESQLLASVKQLDDSGLRVRDVGSVDAARARRRSRSIRARERQRAAHRRDRRRGRRRRSRRAAARRRRRCSPIWPHDPHRHRARCRTRSSPASISIDARLVRRRRRTKWGDWRGDPSIADPIWLNAWTAEALGAEVGDACSRVRRVGRRRRHGLAQGRVHARRRRADDRARRRSHADAGLSRHQRSDHASPTGIRRSRSICRASRRATRTTGSATGPRRRRSSRTRWPNGCGGRASAG